MSFKSGTSWLTPAACREIDAVVSVLLAFPEARIEVQAHADNRGPEEINNIVSTARADAVVDYMIKQGAGGQQLVAKGYGESKPIATNNTEEGRRANRRIQLVTIPSLTPAVRVSRLGLGGPMPAIKFKSGTTELVSSAEAALGELSDQLRAHPTIKIALLVYVDEPSDSVSNLSLSRDQANTLVRYLEAQGVDRHRLVTEPYGKELPLAQTVTEKDRDRNRRVEIRVLNEGVGE